MLLRVHTVPLDARDGNDAEPEDDHFSIVSGVCGRVTCFPAGHGGDLGWVWDLEVSLDLLL